MKKVVDIVNMMKKIFLFNSNKGDRLMLLNAKLFNQKNISWCYENNGSMIEKLTIMKKNIS